MTGGSPMGRLGPETSWRSPEGRDNLGCTRAQEFHPNRRAPMSGYTGLDAHWSSCALGVMTPKGKRVGSHVGETNARCLIEAVRQILEPRHICLEEGTLKGRGRFGALDCRAKGYRWARDDVVRVKNRLESLYHSRACR